MEKFKNAVWNSVFNCRVHGMANSRIPGSLGAGGQNGSGVGFGVLGAGRSSGTTFGMPLVLSGDTPGPLGLQDYSDPNFPLIGVETSVLSREPICRAPGRELFTMDVAIKLEQLMAIFPTASQDYMTKVAKELNGGLSIYCLNTGLRQAHFFAQLREEAGEELVAVEEVLAYSSESLKKKSGYYEKHAEEADEDGYKTSNGKLLRKADPEKIANKVYSDKYGNGSFSSGDGWRYRGRGLMQITFKSMYAAITKEYDINYGSGDNSIDFEKILNLLPNFLIR